MAASCSPPQPSGGTYFATYRGSFVGPEPALENSDNLAA
jgi:hypothetical protein